LSYEKRLKTFKCFGIVWDCFDLCFGVGVWIAAECVGFALGLFGGALGVFGLLLVCREIAKIIKSVMAITELKKIAKKKCKLLKLLELLGLALVSFGCCFGSSWLCCREFETLSANVPDRTR
jgi:hypothetical protein